MTFISKARDEDRKYKLPKQPNAEGHLTVSSKPPHRIYWHEYGNAMGEPVLFIHGGPGGATTPDSARFFDPERYRIILFDQRGCGKSMPNAAEDPEAALAHNTTRDLIADIERLRKHLGLTGKMHVFGGSWGSTLALAYGIAHPRHVQALVLRGIFLCRRGDIDYFYQGNAAHYHKDPLGTRLAGTYQCFPEAWKHFVEVIPKKKRHDMVKAYAKIFAKTPKNDAQRKQQDAAALAWSVWEGSTSYLAPDPAGPGHYGDPEFAKAFARIENHYFMNGAFFTGKGAKARHNNYLLKHAHKIAPIPTYIVQGQYDQVCPRFQADALVETLRSHGAKVYYELTAAGHGALELETLRALTRIMDELPTP